MHWCIHTAYFSDSLSKCFVLTCKYQKKDLLPNEKLQSAPWWTKYANPTLITLLKGVSLIS